MWGGNVEEIKPTPPDSTVVHVQHMERPEREREEGQKQSHYLNISPYSLFGQAGFAC